MWLCCNKTLFTKTGSGLSVTAAYRPSSGAEWEGAHRSTAEAEVNQGCRRRFFSKGWNGVATGWQGAGQSCQITSRAVPGAGRRHREAGAGGRRQSQQLQVQSPEQQGRIRRGLGAGQSSSALPGVARPRALHLRAVLLRQDTHRADFKRNV